MDANIINSQSQIIVTLQEKLVEAIAKGDWSATDNWGKYLYNAVLVYGNLAQENFMTLKENIEYLAKAIADKDALIANLRTENTNLKTENELLKSDDATDKTQILDFAEGQKAAEALVVSLQSIQPG
jgi:hypothetical protein